MSAHCHDSLDSTCTTQQNMVNLPRGGFDQDLHTWGIQERVQTVLTLRESDASSFPTLESRLESVYFTLNVFASPGC